MSDRIKMRGTITDVKPYIVREEHMNMINMVKLIMVGIFVLQVSKT